MPSVDAAVRPDEVPPEAGQPFGGVGGSSDAEPLPGSVLPSPGKAKAASKCELVKGRLSGVRAASNPKLVASIELDENGKGLVHMQTLRAGAVVMDARVTGCGGGSITILGSNGRTEEGALLPNFRQDYFVAPYNR